jgi:two-component system, NarL family, sensor histidine kinase DegS
MPDEIAAPATTDASGSSEGSLADRLAADLAMLDRELGEIDLLVTQAKAEATRHEGRRSTASDKLEALATADGDAKERLDLAANLITLTKRAALMESQVDVLEGKRRALARYRDAVADYGERLAGGPGGGATSPQDLDGDGPMPPAVSRLLLSAQEDLRREIARAMHDGPAQSLTNIVLQAQIVERLVEQDPAMAAGEVRQLIAMVQGTLDATKSFIFDVRPMVLDDLGLVPTIRRAVRERGQRAGIVVEFESLGQDRRLPMDLESGLFRILDEALAAYLAARPEQVTLRLDWGEQLTATVAASRPVGAIQRAPGALTPVATDAPAKELPPALAAMMEDRLSDERDALEAAEREAIVELPATTWREIQSRAGSIGVQAELLADGGELRLVADLPTLESAGA